MQQTNTFAKTGKASLYNTTNSEYGTGIYLIKCSLGSRWYTSL